MSTVQNSVGRKSNDRLGPYQWHCYAFTYVISTEVVHSASVGGGDGLHSGHVTAQSGANDLNRVRADFGVDVDQAPVIYCVAARYARADHVCIETRDKGLEQGSRGLVEKVAPVFGGV